MKNLSAVTWRDSKNVLITKLITNVNFLIFHKKVVLVKLSIGKTIKLQDFWSEYIFKNLPESILIKFVMCSNMQEHFLY